MSFRNIAQFLAEKERRQKFPTVPDAPPPQTELIARAARDIESGVCDLVIAANEAPTREDLLELQAIVEKLALQMEAVVSVTKDLRFRKFTDFVKEA